jgi:hypothetical protein
MGNMLMNVHWQCALQVKALGTRKLFVKEMRALLAP